MSISGSENPGGEATFPVSDGEPGAAGAASDSVEALSALYAAERADVQNVLAHSLTMVSILVGYSAVIGSVWEDVPKWMTVFLPVPVFAAVGWHSQMNSLVFAHNQSISVLERKLKKLTPSMSEDQKLWVGANCGRLVTDVPILWKHRRVGMLGASLTAYGAVGSIVLALTVASVWVPIKDHYMVPLAIGMGVVYSAAIILLAASYASTFQINEDVLAQWARNARRDRLI